VKRAVGGVIAIVGFVLSVFGIITKVRGVTSIVIGGADGPTSVFIAGKVGNGFGLGTIFSGAILIVAGVFIIIKSKKK